MSSTHIPKRTLAVIDGDSDPLTVEEPHRSTYVPYKYSPLPRGDYFRLLELLPGEQDTTLHGNLAHYDLDAFNVPPYRALSYTWGESKYDRLMVSGRRVPLDSVLRKDYDIRHPLYCEGKRLLISTNLRDALRRLRHPFLPVKLWIDAVCINQEDDLERSAQIMLMTRIYHHASPVILWLGEEDDDTVPAFDLIRLLAQSILKLAVSEQTFHGALSASNAPRRLQAVGVPPVESPQYGAVIRLLDRPVFRRVWCVQEAAVAGATTVICGDANRPPLLYAEIATAIMILQKAGWKSQLQRLHAGGWDVLYFPETVTITQRNWFAHRLDQQGLAYALRMFEATDPRDKIFAILGLLGDYAHRGLHDLTGKPREDECKEGHASDCPHWREQTRNWAQTKLETNGGLLALMHAANSRIYRLVDQLIDFYDAIMKVLSFIRDDMNEVVIHREGSEPLVEAVGALDLEGSSRIDTLRASADKMFIDIRHDLDKMTNEFVSSDELVAYNWASKAIEDFVKAYDELCAVYKRGRYIEQDVNFLEDIFGEIQEGHRLLKEGSDSSSSQESSFFGGSDGEQYDAVNETERFAATEDVIEHQGTSGYEDSDAASDQSNINERLGDSIPHLLDEAPELDLSHEKLEIAGPRNNLPSLDQKSNTSKISRENDNFIKQVDGLNKEHQDAANDTMVVEKDEIPAEISLVGSSGGWDKVIGLEYMAPRQPAERPVLTAEPLQPWGPDLALLPDYRLSIAEVYRNFTIQCMIKEKSIDMLSSIDIAPKPGSSDLPSWVPDFQGNPNSLASSIILSDQSPLLRQNLTEVGEPEISWNPSDPQLLALSGQLVDTLKTVSTLRSATPGFKSAHEEWTKLSDLSSDASSEPYKMNASAYKELLSKGLGLSDGPGPNCPPTIKSWGQLIGDLSQWFDPTHQHHEDLSERPWKCYFAFLALLQVQLGGVIPLNEIEVKLAESGITDIMDVGCLAKAVKAVLIGRRMAYTERGHIVFVPETVASGDQVCFFKGAKIPYVLRPTRNATGPETYELLGECISHSMILDDFRKSLLNNWQIIRLR